MKNTKFRSTAALAGAALLSALLLSPVPALAHAAFAEVTASQGEFTGDVRIDWSLTSTSDETPTSYEVIRYDVFGEETCVASGITNRVYDDRTVEPGMQYRYVVRGFLDRPGQTPSTAVITSEDDIRDEIWGWAGNLKANPAGLPIFDGFEATQGVFTDKVRLDWSGSPLSSGKGEYEILRAPCLHREQAVVIAEHVTGTTYYDTAVEPDVKYDYAVRHRIPGERHDKTACTEYFTGWSTTSVFVNFTATQGTHVGEVRLSWRLENLDEYGVLGYFVFRYPERGLGARFTSLTVTWLEFSEYEDTTAEPGVKYRYQIVSIFSDNSAKATIRSHSEYATGWAAGEIPDIHTVTDLSATQGTLPERVGLTWTAPENADTFALRRYHTEGSETIGEDIVAGLTGTAYDDWTAEPYVRYSYAILVTDIYGRTSQSPVTADGWWLPETPVVTDLEASQGTWAGGVSLAWTAPAYAATFKVRRWHGQGYTDLARGLTASGYEDTTAEPGEVYRYQIILTDEWGRTSESDFATGWRGERPVNDDFGDAWAISAKSGSSVSTNANATFQAGESFPSGVGTEVWRDTGATNTLWWKFTAPCGGRVRFATDGSHDASGYAIRTAMAVWTGDALGSLREVCRAYGDRDHERSDGACTNEFEVSAGTVYRIQAFSSQMDDGGAGKGTICLNWAYTHLRLELDPNGGTISTNAVMVPVGQKLGDAMQSFPMPEREGYR
ncbi:MAG: hypothetical protein IK066_10530, partial [Kiritimatiellae bacterium]|nr:hypothetical protein [Kiritimatiellia bacterium]